MAKVLIFEPHGDIRTLFEIVIARLGHEAVVCEAAEQNAIDVDAAVIDPADGEGLSLARRLRRKGVPIVFTSIFPAGPDVLDLAPSAYLLKPFALYSLEQALGSALAPAHASASI